MKRCEKCNGPEINGVIHHQVWCPIAANEQLEKLRRQQDKSNAKR